MKNVVIVSGVRTPIGRYGGSLRPIYPNGVGIAGNSSTENDGAAAVVLMSETKVQKLNVKPMAYFRACAIAGSVTRHSPTLQSRIL